MKTEEIVYPELPPGYVYRKPGEGFKDNHSPPGYLNDIDILLEEAPHYYAAMVAYVRVLSEDYELWMSSNPLLNKLCVGTFPTAQDALNAMVARMWMGVWE